MTNEVKTNNRPSHVIYQVIGEDTKARWIRVGAAWQNRDKKGFTLKFDAYPVTGRTIIRENSDKVDAEKGGQQ